MNKELKRLIKKLGLSQAQAAHKVGVSAAYLSNLLSGKQKASSEKWDSIFEDLGYNVNRYYSISPTFTSTNEYRELVNEIKEEFLESSSVVRGAKYVENCQCVLNASSNVICNELAKDTSTVFYICDSGDVLFTEGKR